MSLRSACRRTTRYSSRTRTTLSPIDEPLPTLPIDPKTPIVRIQTRFPGLHTTGWKQYIRTIVCQQSNNQRDFWLDVRGV